MADKHPQLTDKWIGLRIRQRRREKKLTQVALARRVGITYQQIHKYERGQTRITVSRLYDIAEALGTDLGWFFEKRSLITSPLAARIALAEPKDVGFITAYLAFDPKMKKAIRHVVRAMRHVKG